MKNCFIIFCLIGVKTALACNQDTLILKEIAILNNVKESQLLNTLNLNQNPIHDLSPYKTFSIGEVLMAQSGVFMRHSGTNKLSTISLRGLGPNHTLILWNAFPLETSTSGVVDFNLLSTFFVDSLFWESGGATMWGSTAMSGIVQLKTIFPLDTTLHFSNTSTYSTLQNFQQFNQLALKKQKWGFNWRSFYQKGNNIFQYYNSTRRDSPLETIQNNASQSIGYLAEQYYQIHRCANLIYRFWYQQNERFFPPTLLQTTNTSFQKDDAIRQTLEYVFQPNKFFKMDWRNAFFNEQIQYFDPSINLSSTIQTKRFITELNHAFFIPQQHYFNLGLLYNFNQAITQNYNTDKQQHKFAILLGYNYTTPHKRFLFYLQNRLEWINQTPVFTGQIGLQKQFFKTFELNLNISKNYRYPTLNDLYWQPGGNTNLLPEEGYLQELIIQKKIFSPNIPATFKLTFFNNWVQNLIVWTPVNPAYWTPSNSAMVWARGLDVYIEQKVTLPFLNLHYTANYSFTISTNQKNLNNNPFILNKQLIYIPIHKFAATIKAHYLKWTLRINLQTIGKRFVESDNTQFLEPYTLTNLVLSHFWMIKKIKIEGQFFAYNIFNTHYQNIALNPEPLLNFKIGTNITL